MSEITVVELGGEALGPHQEISSFLLSLVILGYFQVKNIPVNASCLFIWLVPFIQNDKAVAESKYHKPVHVDNSQLTGKTLQ